MTISCIKNWHRSPHTTPLFSDDPIVSQGITTKREFRVCDEGGKLHVREDICKGGDTMLHKESRIDKKYKDTPLPPSVAETTQKPPDTVADAIEHMPIMTDAESSRV